MTTILTLILLPLVGGLGSDAFATRERCQQTLEALSWLARPALQRGLRSADPEIAYRCETALRRSYAQERAILACPYSLPGWCDDATADYYAAEEHRWRSLLQTGINVGAFRPHEAAPWPYQDGAMSRTDQVKAIINYGRSQYRQDGVLQSHTPWQGCVNPDGPPAPPGSNVINLVQ